MHKETVPIPPQEAPQNNPRTKSSKWAQFERIVLMATFVSIILGTVTFLIDIEDRNAARADLKSDAINRAWSSLATQAVGNSGKVEAIEYLKTQDRNMSGIDVSCAKMGGPENWDTNTFRCKAPVVLQFGAFSDIKMDNANLNGADLTCSVLDNASLKMTKFNGARLVETSFKDVDLEKAEFQRGNLEDADFTRADVTNADFTGAFLSKATFKDAIGLSTALFDGAWAWNDQMPVNLNAKWIHSCSFDDRLHKRHILPDICKP